MGSTEVQAFLTHLAVEMKVSGSTQNQALASLLFLYRECCSMTWNWRAWSGQRGSSGRGLRWLAFTGPIRAQ
jgi:hypothetical protein